MNRRNNKEISNNLYSVVNVAVGPGRVRLKKQTKSQNSLRIRAAAVVTAGPRRPIPHRQSTRQAGPEQGSKDTDFLLVQCPRDAGCTPRCFSRLWT